MAEEKTEQDLSEEIELKQAEETFEADDTKSEECTEEETEDETSQVEENEESCESEEKIKKSFFKKKKDKKDEKIEELNDRLMRTMAEFDNYRKRTEKEKTQMFEIGAKSIVEKLLPVVDNFERGFDGLSEEERSGAFVQGIEMIYKQMMTSLEEAGVKVIEALNQEFNPNYHNAVMHEENEAFGENTVCLELQKGYMYRDSVIRHSMVKVAN